MIRQINENRIKCTLEGCDLPNSQHEWNKFASAVLKANLKAAGMNYKDLSRRLAEMGVDFDNKIISSKLRVGSFTATFFMQALCACGVDVIELPQARNDKVEPTE